MGMLKIQRPWRTYLKIICELKTQWTLRILPRNTTNSIAVTARGGISLLHWTIYMSVVVTFGVEMLHFIFIYCDGATVLVFFLSQGYCIWCIFNSLAGEQLCASGKAPERSSNLTRLQFTHEGEFLMDLEVKLMQLRTSQKVAELNNRLAFPL